MFKQNIHLKMKKVRLFLALLAMVFMVSACELSPEEIQPVNDQFVLKVEEAAKMDPGPPLPPPED